MIRAFYSKNAEISIKNQKSSRIIFGSVDMRSLRDFIDDRSSIHKKRKLQNEFNERSKRVYMQSLTQSIFFIVVKTELARYENLENKNYIDRHQT